MKKILHIFPHGVIITSDEASEESQKNSFTNQEFEKNICGIRKRLQELESVEVVFDDDGQTEMLIKNKCDLHSFLMEQQRKADSMNSMVELEVKIAEKSGYQSRFINKDDKEKNQANNVQKTHSYHVKSIQVEWEGVNSYLHVFIDTTNILKLEEAKNNIKCQKIMFASASHEFRTPLNAIINSYQFIGDIFDKIMQSITVENVMKKTVKTQSDRIKKFIKMGNNSSILLLALIDDILDLSKMEAGTFTIHNDDFSIGVLLDEVEDIFNTQCEQKGIRFNIDIGDEVDGAHLWSDKGRIKQVLLNLISNAVKFTFAGSITITVRKEVRDNNCVVVFVISDSGIGIKDDDQKQLFSLFGMISEVQVLNPNGTGIGLTVCQKYVEKLGGTIKLESKYGKGTDVTFWIPNIEKKPIKKIKEIMGLSPPIKNKKSKGNLLFNIEYESLFVIAREDGKINTPVSRKVNSNYLKRFMS